MGPRRAERIFFALIILISLHLILQFAVATASATSSASGESSLPSSNLCHPSIDQHYSLSFIAALHAGSKYAPNLSQEQQRYTFIRPSSKSFFHSHQKILPSSSTTALGFWTRSTSDHSHSEERDLTADEFVKKQGVDVNLVSDENVNDVPQGIEESKSSDADVKNDDNIYSKYDELSISSESGSDDQISSKYDEIRHHLKVINGEATSNHSNQGHAPIASNTTDAATVQNRTNPQEIENATVLISSENGTIIPDQSIIRSTSKSKKWRERLSSIPGAMVLPGTPLFMRLMPIKSSEIINKIIHEEIPPGLESTDLQDEELNGAKNEPINEIDNATILSKVDEEDDVENEDYSSDQGQSPNATKNNVTSHHQAMNETINGSLQTMPLLNTTTSSEQTANKTNGEGHTSQSTGKKRRKLFFQRKAKPQKKESSSPMKMPTVTKEELECPVIATNIHELQSAVLIDKIPLRDVGFRFPIKGSGSDVILGNNSSKIMANETNHLIADSVFFRNDPVINGSLSSLMTCDAKSSSDPEMLARYQRGIALMNLHPVLSIVRERVKSKSKPGNRLEGDPHHLALVIEGGGMRGSVSAGMAAALSTLDLLDAFDSIHGSSAGAIVGAYLVSRQLCTDVYTDIMPAAGSRFASKKHGIMNFGVDWLGDVIQRKILATSYEEDEQVEKSDDGICEVNDELEGMDDNATSSLCSDDEDVSSVDLAMGRIRRKKRFPRGRHWSDDHYDGVLFESAKYLFSGVQSSVSKPLSFGARKLGKALRPALSALDVAASMRQYLKRRPGMNLTYILDGIMDETHGLRPFDVEAFQANDKKQPLYVIASTASNGGKGEMETIAFNSKDGDFFGIEQESDTPLSSESDKWYWRMWAIFKFVPYTMFTAAWKRLFPDASELAQPLKDSLETEMLPAGTSAMYGFADRQRIRNLKRPQEDNKSWDPTGRITDEGKKGLFPCLEASMLVPGAAGPPIQLIRSMNRKFVEQRTRFPRFRPRREMNQRKEVNSHLCFDAFAYEPIPYRSAVEKAKATHVLALRSRPDGCVVESRQHLYERAVGPIYFRKHGMNQVAKLFRSAGSQYRYIEDALTLNEGLTRGIAMGMSKNDTASLGKGVKVPPTELFYGTDKADTISDTDDWKRAHLLPITLPYGTPELPTLSQDKEEVIRAVRNGYAAAFDVLAPLAGLPFDAKTIPGEKVASILFPDGEDDVEVLTKKVKIKPSYIGQGEEESKRRSFATWIIGKREKKKLAKDEIAAHPDGILARRVSRRSSLFHETDQYVRDDGNTLEYIETEALLAALPGFRGGRLDHIAENLLAKEERKRESQKEEQV